MKLLLVRHGEVQDASPHRCVGVTDAPGAPLPDAVLQSLVDAAQALHPQRLLSSDLARCRLLADSLGHALGLSPSFAPGWREMNFGEWENRAWSEIQEQDKSRLLSWIHDLTQGGPPGGEPFTDFDARVAKQLAQVAESGQSTVAISHPAFVRIALCQVAGWRKSKCHDIAAPPGAAFLFEHANGGWHVSLKPINADVLST